MPQEHMPLQHSSQQSVQQGKAQAAESAEAERSSQYEDAAQGLDSVLDDIESVLENNAEDYVNHFVQKGGE
ncbi:MAG: ubiquitin-like protein Pup [Bifidobacteriaceae bacterium]|nr:ubiquitin-like protein Pup [Bifidobacteriaceae bacterium]